MKYMTVEELRKALADVPGHLEVTVRASDDDIGDICGGVWSVSIDHAHDGDDTPFLAIEVGTEPPDDDLPSGDDAVEAWDRWFRGPDLGGESG